MSATHFPPAQTAQPRIHIFPSRQCKWANLPHRLPHRVHAAKIIRNRICAEADKVRCYICLSSRIYSNATGLLPPNRPTHTGAAVKWSSHTKLQPSLHGINFDLRKTRVKHTIRAKMLGGGYLYRIYAKMCMPGLTLPTCSNTGTLRIRRIVWLIWRPKLRCALG